MRLSAIVLCCLAGGIAPAIGAPCPGNPNALGTSRTITVEPAKFPRIGTIQYRNTLPLKDHEVLITFDDGPLAPYTNRVLDTLAAECVKVTYFLVGQMANADPDLVRRIYNAGHTIGTHSHRHPLGFDQLDQPRVKREVEGGIAAVKAALGDPKALSPFFRIPGLARSREVEYYLASKSLAVWSADGVADDWIRGVNAKEIVRRAIRRLDARGHRGVLLLHDIQPATALALPALLKELKARGYRVVHAVPAGERPKSVPERPAPLVADGGGWPRVTKASLGGDAKTAKVTKPARTARKMAANDRIVTGSIAKNARKAQQTATADRGWFRRR